MFEDMKELKHKTFLHVGYHKCLTVYFKRVLECLAGQHSLERIRLSRYNLDKDTLLELRDSFSDRTVVFHVDSITNETRKQFFDGIRGSHFIRDPRDLVISASYYHRTCREKWCQMSVCKLLAETDIEILVQSHTMRKPEQSESYQSYLQKHTIEETFIIEIFRMSHLFEAMRAWDYASDGMIELRYEDIVGNEKESFRKIFTHYGLPRPWIRTGMECAEKFARGRSDAKIKHIRSGEPGQWKKEFSPQVKEIFKEQQGELLIHLGYEQDFGW